MFTTKSFAVRFPTAGIVMLGGLVVTAFASLAIGASILSEGHPPALDTLVASILIPGACMLLSGLAFLFVWNRSPKVASRLLLPVPILCLLQLFFLLSGSYQYFTVTFGIGHVGAMFVLMFVSGVLGVVAAVAFHSHQVGMKMADAFLASGDVSRRRVDTPTVAMQAENLTSYWASRSRRRERASRRRIASSGIRLVGYPR